jgi:hypothetical protein
VNFTRPKLSLRSLFFPALFGLFLIGGPIIGLLTDARWFESLGAGDLFWQRLQIQGALFAGSTLASLIFLLLMIWIASVIARRGGATPSEPSEQAPRPEREPLVNERGQIRIDGLGEALRDLLSAGAGGGGTAAAVGSRSASGRMRSPLTRAAHLWWIPYSAATSPSTSLSFLSCGLLRGLASPC